jgi:hypothetical protein
VIYKGDLAVLAGFLPVGSTIVDGYAVAWADPTCSQPNALFALTLTINDPSITPTTKMYMTTATGLVQTDAVVMNGQAKVMFTQDPGFAAAQAAAAPTSVSSSSSTPAMSTTSGAAAAASVTPPTTGGAPTEQRSGLTVALAVALTLVVVSVVLGVTRRRRPTQ